MTDGFSLYRRRNDMSVNWDGKTLNTNGPIGVQRGRSVAVMLQELKAEIDFGSNHTEDNFRKLLLGRLAAVALRTSDGDRILATNREFNGKIEKLPTPLSEKPFYLVFSTQFYAEHREKAQDVWRMIEQVRNSPDYAVIENSFR